MQRRTANRGTVRHGFRWLESWQSKPPLAAIATLCALTLLGTVGCSRGSADAPNGASGNALTAEADAAGGAADASVNGMGARPGAASPSAAARQAPPPRVYTLEAGSPIRVRTTSTISTRSFESGQTFVATLAEPLVVEDKVIASRGAEVIGRVVNADPGGRVKGVASLTLTLAKLQTLDGNQVDLDTNNIGRRARTTKKKDATKIGIGTGIGAAIGALAGGGKGAAIGAASGGGAGTGVVLATRGDPAVVPAESLLTFQTQAPITFNN